MPGLLAAGDVAQAPDPLSGRHQVVALWASARRQGRTAGRNMAGVHAEDAGCVPCNIQKVGDLLFASAGSLQEYDRLEVRPEATACRPWRTATAVWRASICWAARRRPVPWPARWREEPTSTQPRRLRRPSGREGSHG